MSLNKIYPNSVIQLKNKNYNDNYNVIIGILIGLCFAICCYIIIAIIIILINKKEDTYLNNYSGSSLNY